MVRDRILVIDESKVNRLRIKKMLPPDSPYTVLEAHNGQQALNLLAREHRKLNLIILDFLISQVTGWEVFQEIQLNQETNQIPLVLMAKSQAEITAKIPSPFTYFEFLPTPFGKKQLEQAVSAAIAKIKQRRLSKKTIPPLQPRENDVVLGGQNSVPLGSLVLGGIEGVKMRLNSGDPSQQVAALKQAFQYGEAGRELLIEALQNQSLAVKTTAYALLKQF